MVVFELLKRFDTIMELIQIFLKLKDLVVRMNRTLCVYPCLGDQDSHSLFRHCHYWEAFKFSSALKLTIASGFEADSFTFSELGLFDGTKTLK